MPAMPGHMVVGRGNGSGPTTGGYIVFNYGPMPIPASLTDPGKIVIAFPAPCDMRLERIQWNFRQVAAGAVDTIAFFKNSTPVLAGATSLTSLPGQFDLDYVATAWSPPLGETLVSSGTSLNTSARDITQGQWVICNIITDAAADGTTLQNIDDFNIAFVFAMTGHVASSSELE